MTHLLPYPVDPTTPLQWKNVAKALMWAFHSTFPVMKSIAGSYLMWRLHTHRRSCSFLSASTHVVVDVKNGTILKTNFSFTGLMAFPALFGSYSLAPRISAIHLLVGCTSSSKGGSA